ncbi:hypothetical protein LC087_03585 [Bacillus carboniphilus]|uniref:Uncharacterized protein n=1 Tax=Bacillus carboniphilus TaxID=86663 RepID=A0ABY9JV70_9BACI|nr:hypothetical protein [Bacillus carboniphilus]WLR43287.1 hypothetical protein LC087_03585 [Bacillus carboniphilus]
MTPSLKSIVENLKKQGVQADVIQFSKKNITYLLNVQNNKKQLMAIEN